MFRNRMGKVMFIRVEDEDEDGVQLLRISLVDVGDATYTICKALDIGDHLAVRGAHERGPDGEHVIRVLHVRT